MLLADTQSSAKKQLTPEELRHARVMYAIEFDRKLIEAGTESMTRVREKDYTTLEVGWLMNPEEVRFRPTEGTRI